MSKNSGEFVVVTGASTGIGHACVKDLVELGFHVFGCVRKEGDAEKLRSQFGQSVTPLLFDVTDHDAVHKASLSVREQLGENRLSGLVNNAGVAITGPILHLDMSAFRKQFEINFFGQIAVIQAFVPLLKGYARKSRSNIRDKEAERPGRVINMSSVSGKVSYPFFGPYAGSKYALEAVSDSLRRELLLYGIDVIVIEPGRIRTPIWNKAKERGTFSMFAKTDYGAIMEKLEIASEDSTMLPVEAVSRIVCEALCSPRPKTRYAIPDNRLRWFLSRYLPDRWLDRKIGKRLGLME